MKHLVVIGSSAGGVEALTRLVSTLPDDFPAPILIAQHLDPHHPSYLADILSRHTGLPVRMARETEELRAQTIFVVPSNRNVRVEDGVVSLEPTDESSPAPSVDRLFRSAAKAWAEDLIAVILSGTGSDGAVGARVVNEAGGTVIIQDPATAAFPGMPNSLAPTTVDVVADLDQIGEILVRLVSGFAAGDDGNHTRGLDRVLTRVRDRRGVDFGSYRRATIVRRLQRRLAATKSETVADYLTYLDAHPEEEDHLVSSFLIKVTEFMRDEKVYAYLTERALPTLVAEAMSSGEELRFWSAGCATGEEAYSIAICIAECFRSRSARVPVRIFATDLDENALDFARRGIYPQAALRALPPAIRERYFHESDGECRVEDSLRGMIVFGLHDLVRQPPFPRIDLAVCRNVLMYFKDELQSTALQALAFAVRPDGRLVLGAAESARRMEDVFGVEQAGLKIYRRTAKKLPARLSVTNELTRSLGTTSPGPRPLHGGTFGRPGQGAQAIEPDSPALFRDLPVGVVVVDTNFDIRQINRCARNLLGIHGIAENQDLIRLLHGVSGSMMRDAVGIALKTGRASSYEETVTTSKADIRRLLYHCVPRKEGERIDAVVMTITDVTSGQEQQDGDTMLADGPARDGSSDLQEAVRRLTLANDELVLTNDELRQAADRAAVASVDAEATNEELQTYSEEMQATTEELETLNEELRSAVEELNLSNIDLAARAQEVAAQRQTSDLARSQLETIFDTMTEALAVINGEGEVIQINPAYDLLLRERETSTMNDAQGVPLSLEDMPEARAARGESFSMDVALTAESGTRRWFEVQGRAVGDSSEGRRVVVVYHEVTQNRMRAMQEEFAGMASHELRTPLTSIQGHLQLLIRNLGRGRPSSESIASANVALRQTRHLGTLIEDLLDMARVRTGKHTLQLDTVDVTSLAARVVEESRLGSPEPPIRFASEVGPINVLADSSRLQDVLEHLLSNARAYAPESDTIDVKVRRSNDGVNMSVADHGPGIPPHALAEIFSSGYQLAPRSVGGRGGLGLGLAIAKETISAHGGTIEVDSILGDGAEFKIWLPAASEDEDDSATGDVARAASL